MRIAGAPFLARFCARSGLLASARAISVCRLSAASCIVILPPEGRLPSQANHIMRSSLFIILCILLTVSAPCAAQTAPEEGGHEVQIWAGGGHSVPGGTKNTSAFNAGLRYGWILTG